MSRFTILDRKTPAITGIVSNQPTDVMIKFDPCGFCGHRFVRSDHLDKHVKRHIKRMKQKSGDNNDISSFSFHTGIQTKRFLQSIH